jgi:hypothetical protein
MSVSQPEGQEPGGLGGGPERDREPPPFEQPGRADPYRFAKKAAREGWPVPEKWKEPLLAQMVRIAADPRSTAREKTGAFRAILSASKQNLEVISLEMENEKLVDLKDLTARIKALEVQVDVDRGPGFSG